MCSKITAAIDYSGNDYMFIPKPSLSSKVDMARVRFDNDLGPAIYSAIDEIQARWPNTGFEPYLTGVYALYDSPAREEPIGYAVHGGGTDGGEDYSEAQLLAFDLKGQLILHELECF